MKTKLFFSVLFALSLTAFSQTLDSENFNALTLGDIGTDLTGATAGQGGFSIAANNGTDPTTTTNAAASNFQIVTSGNNGTQGAQMTTPNGDKGVRFIFKSIASEWTGRTSGNDIVEVEYSFFTGSATTSRTPFRAIVFGTSGGNNVTIAGLEYDPQTRELYGLGRFTSGGNTGNFIVNLGPTNTDLILDPNTWYTMGFSYDSVTGQVRWKTSFNDTSATVSNSAVVITGMVPTEIDFLSFGTAAVVGPPAIPANNSAMDYVFDDYKSTASSSDTLLSVDESEFEASTISLFPNPANDIITLKTDISIKKVNIFNNLGQVVLTKNSNFSESNEFDITNLKSGLYIIDIVSLDGKTQTQRFIKN